MVSRSRAARPPTPPLCPALPDLTQPFDTRRMPQALRRRPLISEIKMPAPGPNQRHAAPLSLAERRAILEAVTRGGRSQRAVADDPNIHGTHDQIRTVVRDALRDDPSLRDHFPHLRGRPVADVRVLAVIEPDGAPVEHRAAEMLAAAGVDVAGLRIGDVTMRMATRVQVLRNPDGTFSSVIVQVPDIRVRWVAGGAAAVESQVAVSRDGSALAALRTTLDGTRRRLTAATVTMLIILLLVLGAALFRVVGPPDALDVALGQVSPAAAPFVP